MEDVNFDWQKIQLVYEFTQQSLDQKKYLETTIERLSVLESLNKESHKIDNKIKTIVENTTQIIPKALLNEQESASAARKEIISASQELDKII